MVGEEENKKAARQSLVARVDIPMGAIITEEMLVFKRPGMGIEPEYMNNIGGGTARANISKDDLLCWDNIIVGRYCDSKKCHEVK